MNTGATLKTSATTQSKVLELPRRPGSAPVQNFALESSLAIDEEKIFRLQVQLDMQLERELLYKVTLVIEAIAALMLAREWILWWLA